ncbi:MAG: hypothetical protein JWM78_1547 [Verrucomicrobiaceae bacterium]|nr:hypothetical protein [Verrucomicrobiaceae bacterium]
MADILPFQRKPKTPATKRSALCANGHHRWVVWQSKPFDVKRGKLVTVYRCERCGAERSESK